MNWRSGSCTRYTSTSASEIFVSRQGLYAVVLGTNCLQSPNLMAIMVTRATKRKWLDRGGKKYSGSLLGVAGHTLRQDSPNLPIIHSLVNPLQKWNPLHLEKPGQRFLVTAISRIASPWLAPTSLQSLPPSENQMAQRLKVSSGSSACLCKLLSLQGIFEPTLTERAAYFSLWLLLLVISSVCSVGQNEINRHLSSLDKQEGHFSPKATQEERAALPGDSKAEGQKQDRRGRGTGIRPCGTSGPASLLECAHVPPGAAT